VTILARLYRSTRLFLEMRGEARYPYRPLPEIEADQRRRMRRIVAFAHRRVPYYRETMTRLGLTPADFRSAADLSRLPILEPEQIQRDPEYFLPDGRLGRGDLRLRTSGSSGQPRPIYHDEAAIFEHVAHSERDRSIFTGLCGKASGYRQVFVASPAGAVFEIRRYVEERSWAPRGVRTEGRYLSLQDPPEKNWVRLDSLRPVMLHAYGSYLEQLFGYAEATGLRPCLPRVVTFGGDALSESARRLIAERFGLEVFGLYQSTEALKIGFECEMHLGYHANIDLYPVRLVDGEGRDVPHGESGEVIVSNLVNRATVLLNYHLGDITAWLPERCPCGRSLPLLAFVQGRHSEICRLPDGRRLHPQGLRSIFTYAADVWQYQIVQEALDRFRALVVPAADADRPALQARVRAELVKRLGPAVFVEVELVDTIECTKAGKRLGVLSHLREDEGQAAIGTEGPQ
jgi:phenylacetate-CoA ligase